MGSINTAMNPNQTMCLVKRIKYTKVNDWYIGYGLSLRL